MAVTGAAGRIGEVLRRGLRADVERLVLLDLVPLRAEGPGEEVHTVDLLDPPGLEGAFAGVDAVVHLGGIAEEAPLPDLVRANILGTHNVLEAARRADVPRVVLAGSNRVTGFHPVGRQIGPDDPVRPDGLYGMSKVAVEALGQLYADKFGLSVLCLRIGSFEPEPVEPRHLATWLSPRDCVGFVRAALAAPAGGGFTAVYAVSANARRFWALPTPAELAYTPVDDAERYAARIPGADAPADPAAPQAGAMALPEFTLRHLRP
ncbi:epimerase [Embleya scabrispora]|uniref:Epimerase n=1 Tax=Embleya scabrispora TaxID=159449 RepID=A0A1T3P6S4_9ACTN|nr:NAD(P)-dependent oxidoreductase [Embleya scabrispora]OPC84789.1 epimerase [Embleya scabrispora]